MIDREHDLSITKQSEVLRISRGSFFTCRARCRTPISRSCGVSTGCIWSSLRRFADVERPAGCRRVQDRPPACQDAHPADGDRGALSPSPHYYA